MPQIHKVDNEDLVVKLLLKKLYCSITLSSLHGYLVLSILELFEDSLIYKIGYFVFLTAGLGPAFLCLPNPLSPLHVLFSFQSCYFFFPHFSVLIGL